MDQFKVLLFSHHLFAICVVYGGSVGDKFGEDDEGPRLSAALGRAAIFCKYTEAVGFQHHWRVYTSLRKNHSCCQF